MPSLKGVSFSTRPAEKIGIVGRTGAGKSSILSSLFRLVEITSGEISIDNVNVQNLKLNSLRYVIYFIFYLFKKMKNNFFLLFSDRVYR